MAPFTRALIGKVARRPRKRWTNAIIRSKIQGLRSAAVDAIKNAEWTRAVLDGVRTEYAHWVVESFEFDRPEPF